MRRRAAQSPWLRSAVSVLVIGVMYFAFPFSAADRHGLAAVVRTLLFLAGLAVLVRLGVRQTRRATQRDAVAAERISALVTVTNLIAVSFSGVYYAIRDQFHGLQTPLDALYFSVTTMTTVGYGDITAVSQTARAVTIVQMIFDLVIVTTAISVVAGSMRR
jgi:voltage-gated potassium channel